MLCGIKNSAHIISGMTRTCSSCTSCFERVWARNGENEGNYEESKKMHLMHLTYGYACAGPNLSGMTWTRSSCPSCFERVWARNYRNGENDANYEESEKMHLMHITYGYACAGPYDEGKKARDCDSQDSDVSDVSVGTTEESLRKHSSKKRESTKESLNDTKIKILREEE